MQKIISIKDSIIKIKSSQKHFINQIVTFSCNQKGMIIEIDPNYTYILVDSDKNINLSSSFSLEKEPLKMKFDDSYLDDIISVDKNLFSKKIKNSKNNYKSKNIFNKSPLFFEREPLNEQLKTGLFIIDTLIPIGKGQRELIIGDRKTGKTSIAISTIINQKDKNVKVIYVSIGQRQSALKKIYNILYDHDASDYVSIINARADLKLSQYLAPYLAMSLAESIASNNEDVLIIFDELSKHANIIREVSLNLGKSVGREAYPSDLFYLHSKLLERSGKFKKNIGGGSITALPIIEIIEGDFSTILATNIISITDGQIMTDYKKSKDSIYPSINIGLSVSRTGSSVQTSLLKSIHNNVSKIYSNYINSKKYELISLEVSENIKNRIIKGKILNSAFKQFGYIGFKEEQMFLLSKIIEMSVLKKENDDIFNLYERINNDEMGIKIINNFIDNPKKHMYLFKAYCYMMNNQNNPFNGKRIIKKREKYE